MTVLNLGIVAHVDAGKTSLTERLLYAGGVIDTIGSVDAGSTQTDSLALERRRGITIKTAVASFPVGGTTVNLIDTPGHPDFIAEVERALRVLDGAVLVVSAVEGVQAQTRVLMRTLRRLAVPTLIFVNKVDRSGAREESLLRDITRRLTDRAVAVSTVRGLGTSDAAVQPRADDELVAKLVEIDGGDELLGAYVRGQIAYREMRELLAQSSRAGKAYPVFFGSAVTGAGIPELLDGLAELLPSATGDSRKPLSGTVFKVERDRAGAKVAYVRLFDGTLRVRDHLGKDAVVTALETASGPCREIGAGEIGRVHGLKAVRIGDPIGRPHERGNMQVFAPPTLETAIVPARESDRPALHDALTQLAEQDPLINLRSDLTVSLYGEVQKEVIETTLAEDYRLTVGFRPTTTIHVERPISVGVAGETMKKDGNPYFATLELRVEPADGFTMELDVPAEQLPIYLFRTTELFQAALEETARRTLEQGLYGWQVIDVKVTVTRCGFGAPLTTPADYRKLLPLVLMAALKDAGTTVCEPIQRFDLDGPADTLGPVLGLLGKLGAVPEKQEADLDAYVISGLVPAARLKDLEPALPGLTRGEGVVESTFAGYRQVAGPPPTRARWDDNPLDRAEYLLRVERRVAVRQVSDTSA
ncbi:GTP-binding protein [Actinoplanes sp. NPDC051343]|uniref:GTP-binding protein n=1 Tax=Actinoplanes sp. NPDC051343 TaxID=3363906 RepID=UPI003796B985